MGGRPKALLELDGVPLVRRSALALRAAGVGELVVVLGHRAGEVESALTGVPARIVRNTDCARGRVSSVRAGFAALSARPDAVIVALADQPLVDARDIRELVRAFERRGAAAAVVPWVEGERGNPVIVESAVRDAVLAGDAAFGCRQWLDAHPERVVRMDTANRHYCVDVDSPDDIEAFAARHGPSLCWPPDLAG